MDTSSPKPTALEVYAGILPAKECGALEAWLGTFYQFQRDWLLEPSDYAVCNKSRQIGISHTTSAVGVLWGAFHGELTTIISVGELESVEVLDKARRHALVLAGLGSEMACPVREGGNVLCFASGGKILALPSTGGRSFSGNVFLDEFGYQTDAKEVWDAAAAVTLLVGKLRAVSTPNGVGNEFEQLWRRNSVKDPKWARHEIPIEKAIADGYPVDIERCWTIARGDSRLFDQLFRCQFLDNEQQYIPTAAIDACSVDDLRCATGENYAGLDIGRTSNRTELVIVRKATDGVRWTQHTETRQRTSYEDIERLVALAFSQTFRVRRLCVDASGLGIFPAEQLQHKYGKHRVEAVTFSAPVKEDLATGLYSAFVDSTVRIGKQDSLMRDDVCAIRRIVTKAGNIRYDAPDTEHGHADRAWGLALALHASSSAPAARRESSLDARM